MRAARLSDLLKAGDRVAVSNITGREASTVTVDSQRYCGNIVGGWALGKGGQTLDVPGGKGIPVFSTIEELLEKLPKKKYPNKIIVYSPPPAVYGEVKEIVEHRNDTTETLYIITEHVSIEVTAKISQMCSQANIDVLGCNSLGMINVYDKVRVGAVGGTNPGESFKKGCAAIISNSGNMVNTMASYLLSAGYGTSYGISTGKDMLILLPMKNLLELARDDERTKFVVTYIEPGGLFEAEAIQILRETNYPKPIIAYVTGELLQKTGGSLGHAGAVVEGKGTSSSEKMKLFDEYFGMEAFDPEAKYEKSAELLASLRKGIRIKTLHHLPAAARLVCDMLEIQRDFTPSKPLGLNPWFVDYKNSELSKHLPADLVLYGGTVPRPYASQVKRLTKDTLGANPPRRNMQNASHASSNDGLVTRIYGYSVEKEMERGSFVESLLLAWMGERCRDFEIKLVEKCLIASLTNGPGTISAQGAKLSTSAGNPPNTVMIATLASIGDVHGGNGRRAVEYLMSLFGKVPLADPFDPAHGIKVGDLATREAKAFAKRRQAAKEVGSDYKRIPCLGHPVFKNKPVNFDPRERVIANYLSELGQCNVFLDFYHLLAVEIKKLGIARNVWAVNLDGAIASVVLGICWKPLRQKRITIQRVCDIAFMVFALGRTAGAGGEFLDHQDTGMPMDMRVPVSKCTILSRARD